MSHRVGTIQTVAPVVQIGPNFGGVQNPPNTWAHNFAPTPAPTGTRFVILHFRNATFAANAVLEVDLGYGTDTFTAANGDEFWTRPINLAALPNNQVPIRYISTGAATGGVELDQYGRGERVEEEPSLANNASFQSLSNCDPFLVQPNPPQEYMEPDYATYWFCAGSPPNWENINCVNQQNDIRQQVAPAVGMIITVHDEAVSTCSVTLISPNRVITAGHCMADPAEEGFSSSVSFDYAVNCNGHIPNNYNPKFHKVTKVIKFRNKTMNGAYYDYCVLELAVPPGGLGITPITMRNDLPAVNEEVFGIHHPNGAVKKLSRPHPNFATVAFSGAGGVVVNLDVSGGSSGSGLFDTQGRIVGVLSNGPTCSLSYFPTATILPDLNAPPEPEATRDVMIVFDRSGSMSLDAGTGKTKIEEARDAASLFVQLVRAATGNRVGLVSFSTTANTPFGIADVTAPNKQTLIGPAPFTGGIVGGLTPGGSTTIGGGLEAARLQFPMQVSNPRSILLLTDGLQNTAPMIQAVEAGLAGIAINVIGYGTESSLDGELLTNLATAHNGLYTRAMSPLHLKKFFSLAFGNIFEAGAAVDPEFFLPKEMNSAVPLTFDVCGEENVTVVVGWDVDIARLSVRVISPLGKIIDGGTPGAEQSTGRTWTFLRFALPQDGERDGQWRVEVFRPDFIGAAGTRAVDVNYFVNVIVDGGPKLELMPNARRYYTGDPINPLVVLKFRDGTHPHQTKMEVEVSSPAQSIGNILTASRLREPITIDADTIPARQATLLSLEAQSQKPAVDFKQRTFELFDDPANSNGFFEPSGVFGNELKDLLRTEGNYTFRFRATYGEGCTATRELFWTLHVNTGVDPTKTDITSTVLRDFPDGKRLVKIDFIPRDQYGNHVGPGREEGLSITGTFGTTPTDQPQDNRDGSYSVTAVWDPSVAPAPGIVVSQPGRPPAIVQEGGNIIGIRPTTESETSNFWIWVLLILVLLLLLIIIILLLS
ncbi:MAG TPA: trypsin-like peptidase domain-containing protein [Pyrinomonadaceae bacterium]|nr:trypsin-like peptidase domain-containing protein [Pyrinomonadaceae bacterium]